MVSFTITLTVLLASTLVLIFGFLGGLHVYWAAGGRRWLEGVAPEIKGKAAFKPPKAATIAVAIGLFGFGVLALLLAFPPSMDLPLQTFGWVAAAIFLLRAIGEFRYVGFFKRHRSTTFGKRDTLIYSPLCLFISLLFVFLLTL